MRSLLFWDVRQRRLEVTDVEGQPTGPIFKGSPLQMGMTECPETSVAANKPCCISPGERRPHLSRDRSLKPRNKYRSSYRSADKSLVQPGRKQATATEDLDVHISYL